MVCEFLQKKANNLVFCRITYFKHILLKHFMTIVKNMKFWLYILV